MSWVTPVLLISLCYGFLCLAVLLIWLPGNLSITNWGFALLISIVLGLISHQLDTIAIVPIILLALTTYYSQAEKISTRVRVVTGIAALVLSVALIVHQLPGFHNLIIVDHAYIGDDAIPFTLYLNFDKAIVGIFILGFGHHLISNKKSWLQLFRQVVVKAPIVILLLISMAFTLGFVRFDPKIPGCICIWIITNLLFVCVAEEALFRGFIQKNLSLMMKKIKYGDYLALIIAAILFGMFHYPGGVGYVMLATVAGMGYGWIYLSTQRIEGSIITHFGLNLTHFLLFTYPALKSAV